MQSLYPIYIQNPNQEVIDSIATKLGLVGKATRPESNKQYLLEYKDSNAKLVYDPSGGTLAYESVPGVGDLPSFAKAEELARDLMASLGIPIESRQIKVISTQLSSIYENFASLHPTIAVHFLSQREESPILFSDVDHVRYGTEGNSLSPEITVEITGGNKITRLFHTSYAQRLGSTPVTMIDRTLDQAIEELKVYGGHIRSITEQGEQRSNFACADSKCNVYDATITKAYKGYAWNNSVGSLLYTEINDTTPRAFEYLLPVWIFEGTGKMGKSKTDESGKLIPNPDKSDNSQYYVETVKFVSTIPAFSKGSDANILEVKNYTLTIADSGKAKVSFETKYIFPTFKDSSFSYATPRNGIKYRLLVLFPDKTYCQDA
jgi:hypothetical protein